MCVCVLIRLSHQAVLESEGEELISFKFTYILMGEILLRQEVEGISAGANGKEPTCQCRRYKRYRLDSWVGKIP